MGQYLVYAAIGLNFSAFQMVFFYQRASDQGAIRHKIRSLKGLCKAGAFGKREK